MEAASIRHAATEVLDNPGYQTDLPGEAAPPPVDASIPETIDDTPDFSEAPPNAADSEPPLEPPAAAPPMESSTSFGLPHMLLWIAIGGLGILFCFLLLGYLRRRPNSVAAAPLTVSIPEQRAAHTLEKAVIGPIDDAERLAAAGQYGEAIHVILLRFLGELRYGANLPIADSLTSREILRKSTVPPAWRDALGIIIGAVELCHFGGRGADEKLFRHCADAYYAALTPTVGGQSA